MAQSNYDGEIKSSMSKPVPRKGAKKPPPPAAKTKDSPEEIAADTKAGIAQNSPQDVAMDARMAGGVHPGAMQPPGFGAGGGGGDSPAHAAMAASIAHAILQKGG